MPKTIKEVYGCCVKCLRRVPEDEIGYEYYTCIQKDCGCHESEEKPQEPKKIEWAEGHWGWGPATGSDMKVINENIIKIGKLLEAVLNK